nr:adenine phosphoribosyltransferase 1-like [Tanacetum cinerariifolium]
MLRLIFLVFSCLKKVPVKHLGGPLVLSRLLYRDCSELMKKIKRRISDWKNKSLSFAGRAQLIRSVLGSMHLYWASVFILPSRLILELEQVLRGFLWCQGKVGSGFADWKNSIKPSLLRIFGVFFRVKNRYESNAFIRTNLMGDLFGIFHLEAICHGVGGKSCRDIHSAGFCTNSKVADLIAHGSWIWSNNWYVKYPNLLNVAVATLSEAADGISWRTLDNLDGDFSVAKAWDCIRHRNNEEIRDAMFSFADNKASGPDGYTFAFFKEAWGIISADICRAIREFFTNGILLKELNHTIIALIPEPSLTASTPTSSRRNNNNHNLNPNSYDMAVAPSSDDRVARITKAIRVIPDFPKPGILFQDITTLLLDPVAFKDTIDLFVERYKDKRISVVAGVEARGFIFGPPIALAVGAKFVPMRKPNKLPGPVISEEYSLEYGTDKIEMHVGAVQEGERALVIDDLIATGGTLCAAINLLERVGVKVVECACVIELPELKGRDRLGDKPLFVLVS